MAMLKKSGLSSIGTMTSASSRLTLNSAGWRVTRLIDLYMAFIIALAKYALGYGSRFGSYVLAAFVNAKNPSPSRSGNRTDFCHGGRDWTKNLASILASGAYSAASS